MTFTAAPATVYGGRYEWGDHNTPQVRALRLMRPGTRIVVTLPNVLVWHVRLQLLLGRFEYTDSGTLDRTHLRFFTPRTARRLLEDAGFDVVQAGVSWHVPWIGRVRGLALTA